MKRDIYGRLIEANSAKKLNMGIFLILLLGFVVLPMFRGSMGGMDGQISGYAAQVGDEEVTLEEFSQTYEKFKQTYSQFGSYFDFASMALDQIIGQRLLYISALESGAKATDFDVVRDLENIPGLVENGKFSKEKFHDLLRANNLTEEIYRDSRVKDISSMYLREMIQASHFEPDSKLETEYRLKEAKIEASVVKVDPKVLTVEVSPDEVKAFLADEASKFQLEVEYQSKEKLYSTPEQLKVRHILIKKTEQGAKDVSVDKLKKIQGMLAEGKSFAEVAQAESDSPRTKLQGGLLPLIGRNNEEIESALSMAGIDTSLVEKLFELPVGQVSEVLASSQGSHIVLVEEKIPAVKRLLTEAAVQEELAKAILIKTKAPKVAEEEVNRVLAQLIKGDSGAVEASPLKLAWTKTNSFNFLATYAPGLESNASLFEVIFSMKSEGFYQEPVKVGDVFYLIRLDKREIPKADSMTAEKKDLARQQAFGGQSNFTTYLAHLKSSYEEMGKITKNPGILALDKKETP